MANPAEVAGIAVIGGCVLGVAFTSLSEAALLGVSEVGARRLGESRDPRARVVVSLLANTDYLSALIVGMNLFIILISTVMTLLVEHRLADGALWVEEALHIGMVLFILVFAELTPKTYGSLYPERVALWVARPVWLLAGLLRPLVAALAFISRPLARLTRRDDARGPFMTLDEIRAAADVSEEEGLVEAVEAQMLDSVMDMGETPARAVMVPRVDMVAAEESTAVAELAAIASRSGFSRIPVYSENLDNITGIVYVTDILRRLVDGDDSFTLPQIAREPLYFPEAKRIDELLGELREKRIHIGIVVDEFGGTAGLITIEDILEELVGEIEDEHDTPSQDLEVITADEALVGGKMRIEEVNEALGSNLPDDLYETIAGLLSGLAGHIPEAGEEYEVGGVRLTVRESNGQHVERVLIRVVTREDGDV
jgi:putative hemolysin